MLTRHCSSHILDQGFEFPDWNWFWWRRTLVYLVGILSHSPQELRDVHLIPALAIAGLTSHSSVVNVIAAAQRTRDDVVPCQHTITSVCVDVVVVFVLVALDHEVRSLASAFEALEWTLR